MSIIRKGVDRDVTLVLDTKTVQRGACTVSLLYNELMEVYILVAGPYVLHAVLNLRTQETSTTRITCDTGREASGYAEGRVLNCGEQGLSNKGEYVAALGQYWVESTANIGVNKQQVLLCPEYIYKHYHAPSHEVPSPSANPLPRIEPHVESLQGYMQDLL